MKNNIFTFLMILFTLSVSAQSAYEKNIQEKAKKISAAKTVNDYDKLFTEFSSLARSQDSFRWKAYYYAGFTMYKKAELILSSNPESKERETNGLAEKFVSGALANKQDDKESIDLLNQILEQKKKIEANASGH